MTGFIVVISGPSGVGKGTVISRLLSEIRELSLSVSSTTRAPRPGEVNGREYFFLTDEEFSRKIDAGGFIEWAEVHGKKYGTDAGFVRQLVNEGKIVLLEIDVQGADQIRRSGLDALFIFLAPPSMEELEKRLRGRNTECEELVLSRIRTAYEELKLKDRFQYCVENIVIDDTVERIKTIILNERRRRTQ